MNEIVNQIDMRQSGIMEGLSFDKLGELLSYHPEAPMLFSSGLFFILFCLFSKVEICNATKICGLFSH